MRDHGRRPDLRRGRPAPGRGLVRVRAKQLIDDLRAGNPPAPTRGPSRLCTWKQANRILAGFGDGLAAEGPSAGAASLAGLALAKERGWQAPAPGKDATA